MPGQINELTSTAKDIANRIKERDYDKVQIISHIDADGLTAASIASMALREEEIEHKIKFVKQLDDRVITDLDQLKVNNSNVKFIFWFTDLGSGMNRQINSFDPIITDHHVPSISDYDIPIQARMDLLKFGDILTHQENKYHLNPHLNNIDGTHDISGAGTAYLVARELNPVNINLAYLAVIGAIGDLQDSKFHKLIGVNRKIVDDAIVAGDIEVKVDISAFGRESRPIQNLLMYSTDPYFPGLTMSEDSCVKFLQRLEIPLKDNGSIRRWVDLTFKERKLILSELMELLLSKGISHNETKRLLTEVYILPHEEMGSPLHDAKEFATLLNSCGKYNKPEIGYEICLGERSEPLIQAYQLLKGHKIILMESIQFIKELGITDFGAIQHFDAHDKVPDNIIGTIASMMLANNEANSNKPLFAFAITEDGENYKVSARATRKLVKEGINLSDVMQNASSELGAGSVGGGHDIAAGATIPIDRKQNFLEIVEKLVIKQLGITK
jgi:RecJ-like exonuclease